MIFGSLGIGINHLFDLQVAAVILLAVAISRISTLTEIGTGILAASLLVAIVPTSQGLHGDLTRPSFRNDADEVLLRLHGDTRPILAENPLVVIKSGKSPYLLDPFMFRILAHRSEFPEREGLAIFPDPFLTMKDRTARIEFDKESDQGKKGQKEQQEY